MLALTLIFAGCGELCDAYPLETARAVIAGDYWPSERAAAWYAVNERRRDALRLAACETFGRDVAMPWTGTGAIAPEIVYGALCHSWGFRRGLLDLYGQPTAEYRSLLKRQGR